MAARVGARYGRPDDLTARISLVNEARGVKGFGSLNGVNTFFCFCRVVTSQENHGKVRESVACVG